MEGLITLVVLCVLAIPVLLIVALVKIGNAKERIGALENEVQMLRQAVRGSGAATLEMPAAASAVSPKQPKVTPVDPLDPLAGIATTRATAESMSATAQPSPEFSRPAQPTPPPIPPAPPPRAAVSPPSDPLAPVWRWLRRWFTEGNVPVKIGVLVLLAGVAALLKYATDQGWVRFPIEFRLAGIALAAMGALVFAWRQREQRRSFALALQGGAIGVLMLTVFAAYKLYGLLPAGAAFAITIALVAGLGVLAVLQNALALAVFGILSGFLAPIWLSTGSGNHVALFSYYAVLNAAIFGIAWMRPWRMLNLMGFGFTFGIGTVWGVLQYAPQKFASTEPFLLLFFAMYLLIPLLYARRRGAQRRDLVDGTLAFGTPLVAFALQAGLLEGARMPLAWSALALAAIYAGLGWWLLRRDRFRPLAESYALLAVGFATLSVPLALSARATASVFALEGAALVWLGLRQRRKLPQLSGLALQALAAFAYAANAANAGLDAAPIANPAFMSAQLIALAGFATAWCYRKSIDANLVGLLTLWALGWWCFAGLQEIDRHLADEHRLDAAFAFAIFTGWLAVEAWRRVRELRLLAWAAIAALASAAPIALAQSSLHAQPFADWGWAAWLLYAALGWRVLRCLRDLSDTERGLAHAGWLWGWTVASVCLLHELAQRAGLDDGWQIAAVLLPLFAFAAALQLRPRVLAPPLMSGFDAYRAPLLHSAQIALAATWLVSLGFRGNSDPLPWVSVINPLELLQLAALALLARWAWRDDAPELLRGKRLPLAAAAAFVWITVATLRAAHQWGGVDWSPSMLSSTLVQTALTVVWSVLGVLGWVFGSRRGDRLLWAAGAVLMGVVLLKLLLIDRQHLGGLLGIASFLAYGLLCLAIGYFAPAPPRRAQTTEASA